MDQENREQPFEELVNTSGEVNMEGIESVNGSLDETLFSVPDVQENCEMQQDFDPQPCDLGKFKNPQALLDAYNNLQAEFTKKCQRLSLLEKDKIDDHLDEEQLEDVCAQFLSTHAEARNYADQIKDKIRAGKNLSMQAFDDAWAGIVLEKFRSDAAEKQIVDKYVLTNENVRKTIIENYLNSLTKSAPPLTISTSGQRVADSMPATPSSLKEAKALVEKMFS